MGQTNAILRYLGRKYGCYPQDIQKAYKVDSYIDFMMDFLPGLYMPAETENVELAQKQADDLF